LQQELAYASYLNVHAAILPPPRNRAHIASYARAVNECLRNVPFIQLSVRLPIYAPPELRTKASPKRNSTRMASMSSTALLNLAPRLVIPGEGPQRRDGAGGKLSKGVPAELNATWEMWDLIRTMCDYNARLTLSQSYLFLFCVLFL
jgi:protein arginine N-methyltransferase 5